MKFFESGSAIAQLTIAVDGWKRDSEPLWLNLKVWGKLAQVAGDYVRKGSQIAVSGQLENESWTDRTTGEKRSKMVLNVKELTLLGSKKDSDDQGGWGGSPSDEEVPF